VEREVNNKLFVYGILKRGYELDLREHGAKFIGEAHIEGAALYGIGPIYEGNKHEFRYHGVGLRLDYMPEKDTDPMGVAYGELFEVPHKLWPWLDGIEQNGFVYTRKIMPVHMDYVRHTLIAEKEAEAMLLKPIQAWVYEHNYKDFKREDLIRGGRF
jgi:gamma-glutamylcyclotransferase (GGCT)/AIG2-like uncharacterized protein YtfP